MAWIWIPLIAITFIPTVWGQQEGDVRLTGFCTADNTVCRAGRIEVVLNGEWGTVCWDGFGLKDGQVICSQLGFDGNVNQFVLASDSGFTPLDNTLPINIQNLNCDGNEPTVLDCKRNPQVGNCVHDEDVALYCLGVPRTTPAPTTTTTPRVTTTTLPPKIEGCTDSENVRLVSESDGVISVRLADGIPQVRPTLQDDWQLICDDLWDKLDARVICRMLCYNPDNSRPYQGGQIDGQYGNVTGEFGPKMLRCVGDETDIYACPQNSHSKVCTPLEFASVSCMEPSPTTPPVPDPTITCDGVTEIISVTFTDVPNLKPEHLQLADESVDEEDCGVTKGENGGIVKINIPMVGCGSERTYNHSHIIYTNNINYYIVPSGNVITRNEAYTIEVYCAMGRNGDPDKPVVPESRTLPPKGAEGHPDLQLIIYENPSFSQVKSSSGNGDGAPTEFYLDATISVCLELYTGDDLKVILQQVYANPAADPDAEPQYLLIREKCAVNEEDSVQFYPESETKYCFTFRGFKFLNDTIGVIYLHAKGIVCGLDEFYPRCDRTCGTGISSPLRKRRSYSKSSSMYDPLSNSAVSKRQKRQSPVSVPYEFEVDSGPIYIIRSPEPGAATTQRITQEVNLTPSIRTLTTTAAVTQRPISTDSVQLTTTAAAVTQRPTKRPTSTDSVQLTTTTAAVTQRPTQRPTSTDSVQPQVVNDVQQTSAATVLQYTLTAAISLILALIIQ